MKISDVIKTLDASVLCGEENLDKEIFSACGSDLMSDVMAFVKDQVLLFTGLINIQVIRTASLMDIDAICFVRGKLPSQEMVELAKENNIILLTSKDPMYISCGKLYAAGVVNGGVRDI